MSVSVRTRPVATAILAAATATPLAHAADFSGVFPILTALKDTSNVPNAEARYRATFQKTAGEPDLYINSITYSPGPNWNPQIQLNTPTTALEYDGGQSYTFGTPISGAADWFLDRVANLVGPVDAAVAPGVYDFTLNVIGGSTPGATDILASLPFQLDVAPSIDFAITSSASPSPVTPGQPFEISVSLTNNTAGRNLVTNSWYVLNPTFTGPGEGFIDFETFVGDWFDKSISPGQTRTDAHTTYRPFAGLPGGTYTGNLGVIGGFHAGDEFGFAVSPEVTLPGGPALPGDANFNGRIDPDDFALIDKGYANGSYNWVDGDFDDDDIVNVFDYLIIDQAFANQNGGTYSPALLSLRATQFGPAYVARLLAAVPEPSSLLAAVGCLTTLGSRRRRHAHH